MSHTAQATCTDSTRQEVSAAAHDRGEVPLAVPAPVSTTSRPTVIFDTSVVMADPSAHLAYPGADIVIPLTVIDELDANKRRRDDAGRNARTFARVVEELRQANGGEISTPADLPGAATLRVEPNGLHLGELARLHLDPTIADHRIIAAALGVQAGGGDVCLISNDTGLRIKASVLGLRAAEHTTSKVGVHAPSRIGYTSAALDWQTVNALQAGGRGPVSIDSLPDVDRERLHALLENEFLLQEGTALAYRKVGNSLQAIPDGERAWGLTPRNAEQRFALHLLTDPDVALVALRGGAGTGKSILAIAAGLEQVLNAGRYQQLLIVRPMISVGQQDIGFLPGDVADKLAPWFSAVVDAMVALSGKGNGRGGKTFTDCQKDLADWVASGKVALEPVTFLRGRSLQNTFVLVDEAQNLEPSVVKTIISRLGSGSKVVLTGDSSQLDSPWLSETSCGLNVAVDAFAGVDLFGQIFFKKGERSRLADLAAERM